MKRGTLRAACMLVLAAGVSTCWGGRTAQAAELKPGTWTFGGGLGFLGNTPDGTAFALNFYADVGIAPKLSLGPLLQLGVTGDMSQIGVSGQVKYWLGIPDTANRLKIVVQGGLGFIHSDVEGGDTSWLIPIGVGADYAVTKTLSVTGTFLLNFADLHPRGGNAVHVMPGFTIGVRY